MRISLASIGVLLFVLAAISAGCATSSGQKRVAVPTNPRGKTATTPLTDSRTAAKPNLTDPLIRAAANGDLDAVKDLVGHGADINGRDAEKNTPLIAASSGGHPGTASFLLERGAMADAVNTKGETALIAAAASGHTRVVRLLLAKNANTGIVSAQGLTASMAARKKWFNDIVMLIGQHDSRLAAK